MVSDASAQDVKKLLPRIQVQSRQRKIKIYCKSVAGLCAAMLQALGQSHCAISIVFVGVREMRLMNRLYLQRDYATDVLSFAYGRIKMESVPFLGEIVIAPKVAVRHAVRYGVDPEKEIRKLVLHGILHLLGYDHDTDRGQMDALQRRLMRRKLFMSSPLVTDLEANQ